ncbi:hypothetical protein [Paenibacillus sp. FSL H7-0331]|uniref:hypothetical protein n=1 Tax=Paenibacillus sp. FSL H7-0331 TaxID=1920421 RepID=UPI00096C611F|nr:hypothetical protein [Paenibacillus sp. FSL H7-0331]OME97320.1 hypothetical protein BK127_40890 [Paenibacillus sp. FSL H7-0331]
MKRIQFLFLLLSMILLNGCLSTSDSKASIQVPESPINEVIEDINIYNEFLMKSNPKEQKYISSYKKYGDLYDSHDEKAAYEVIVKEVIPQYDVLINDVVNYIPKTKELKRIHAIYVTASYKQYATFYLIKGSIEKNESKLMADSLLLLGEATKEVLQYREEYNDLIKKYSKK